MSDRIDRQLGHLRRMIDGFHRETPAREFANVARQLDRIEVELDDDRDKHGWEHDHECSKLMIRLFDMISDQALRELAVETTTKNATTR